MEGVVEEWFLDCLTAVDAGSNPAPAGLYICEVQILARITIKLTFMGVR